MREQPRRPSDIKAEAAFFEADPTALADHKMVEHGNIQKVSGLHDGARHRNVVGAGRGFGGGMVVGDEECSAIQAHRLLEHLADANLRRIDAADVDSVEFQ
jgi:hypothetical protein